MRFIPGENTPSCCASVALATGPAAYVKRGLGDRTGFTDKRHFAL
jgi:hypothetical protein